MSSTFVTMSCALPISKRPNASAPGATTRLCRAVALAFTLMFAVACSKSDSGGAPVCAFVKVAKGCKAKCSRLLEAPGASPKVCVTQLITRKNSENSILKNEIKKVSTVTLPGEICFEVEGDRPRDASIVQQLKRACGVP